jgi:hypothetical protein
MLRIPIQEETLQELHGRASEFGFTSSEEFVCYVLKELLEALRSDDFLTRSSKIDEQEEKELRAKLRNLGYI